MEESYVLFQVRIKLLVITIESKKQKLIFIKSNHYEHLASQIH